MNIINDNETQTTNLSRKREREEEEEASFEEVGSEEEIQENGDSNEGRVDSEDEEQSGEENSEKQPKEKTIKTNQPVYVEPTDENSCKIKLSNCDNWTIVSKEDYEELSKHTWLINDKGYATSNISLKTWKIHRYIAHIRGIKLTRRFVIDHVFGDKLDNRYEFLRVTTRKGNNQNKRKFKKNCSSYLGVRTTRNGRWQTYIGIDSGIKNLGTYDTELLAVEARDVYLHHLSKTRQHNYPLAFPERAEQYNVMTPYVKKQKGSSKYKYVRKIKDEMFEAMIYHNNERFVVANGTEDYCAKQADKFIVEHMFNKPLNFKDDYPDYVPLKQPKNKSEKLEDGSIKILFKGGSTIIDADDYDKLRYSRVYLNSKNHKVMVDLGNRSTKSVYRFIMNIEDEEMDVDHIDNDVFNNRRSNLRIVTSQQNGLNRRKNVTTLTSSKLQNVSFNTARQAWVVQMRLNAKKVFYGCFEDELDGGRARDLVVFLIDDYYRVFYKMNFDDWDEQTRTYWWDKLKMQDRKINLPTKPVDATEAAV